MVATICLALAMSYTAPDTTIALKGVTITGQSQHNFQMTSSQNKIRVGREYLDMNFSGSLMQSLENIPGVKAMSIGSGQSKPVIRGLGFNRMAVTEDGIKHEGQQWGDDHGLEIDQFAIDRVDIVKGPAALLYGSDAIGGVLNLYTNHTPTRPFEGSIQLFSRTNNESLGLAAKVGGRKGKFFYRANMTLIDYADYRVPADSIQYYSYYIRLKNQRLRNTAGKERDGSVTLGYADYNFHADLRISDAYSKSGFFANAHGLEVRLSDIDYDRSRRDIHLPFQSVNHLKVLGHAIWQKENMTIEGNLAFQNNLRKEQSEPISHGYMPKPADSMERRFDKKTYTAKIGTQITLDRHTLDVGVNAEYQHNRRGGWGFIIPDFETFSIGAYAFDRYSIADNLKVNAGVRYDAARTHIHAYADWYKTPTETGDSVFKQRSTDARRNFNSITWSAGINYSTGNWVLKANVGKSFRVPIPKELGADGVNYHIFRYEKGNVNLKPEESYQIDAGLLWSNERLNIQIDPYLNYFPNYIYMNPTSNYHEGLQMYYYTQARVLRFGFEAQLTYALTHRWEAELEGEYLYAEQLSGEKKGYTLPFSTPWSIHAGLKYLFSPRHNGFVQANVRIVGAQNEIVPPEKPTRGYYTLNASAGKSFPFGNKTLKVALRAENLLNKRYYDHTSFYRLIDVPEPGFNASVMVGLEF